MRNVIGAIFVAIWFLAGVTWASDLAPAPAGKTYRQFVCICANIVLVVSCKFCVFQFVHIGMLVAPHFIPVGH